MSLLIIKASAGSGKTFRLVREYLKLILHLDKQYFSSGYFSRILAITFTNEATAEMKERILKELKILSETPEKSNHFTYFEAFSSKEAIQQRAKECLENILTEYDSFSISTIDKFFQKVMRSIIHEANISGNFDIELDTKKLYQKAIDKRIAEIDTGDPLYYWVDLLRKEKIAAGKNFQFVSALTAIPNDLNSSDYFREFSSEQLEQLDSFYQLINVEIPVFEKKIKDIADKIIQLIQPYNEYFSGNFINPFRSEGSGLIEKIEESKTLKKLDLSDPESHRQIIKKPDHKKLSPNDWQVIAKIENLIFQIFDILRKGSGYYYSLVAIKKNFISFAVFNYLQEAIYTYSRDNQVITLQQSNETISNFVGKSDAPFIYEKIGQKFRHIFVDEFQDTAFTQYRNLIPLFAESLSTANKNLIVGDIKQAIYRWRQGDWRLLHSVIKEDFDIHIREENLESNYRSSPDIVNFNNEFYSFASHKIIEFLNDYIQRTGYQTDEFPDLEAIRDVYRQVHQKAFKKHDGLVQLEFFEKQKKTDDDSETDSLPLIRMTDIINDAINSGYQKKDVLILFRNNREGNVIADHLLKCSDNPEDYRFTSKQSLLIANADSVRLIISVMSYILDKNRWIALGEVVLHSNSLGILNDWKLETVTGTSEVTNEQMEQHLLSSFPELSELRLRSGSMTLLEVTNKVISAFGMDSAILQHEHPYMQKFQDVVLEFEEKEGQNLSEFLDYWEEKRKKISLDLPSDMDAIRLLSMHNSKGLQAPVVIIPFGDLDYKGKRDNIIWSDLPDSPGISPELEKYRELGPFPVQLDKQSEKSYFQKSYIKEQILQYLDTLNLYYVATTRSEDRLHILLEGRYIDNTTDAEKLNLKTGVQLFSFCQSTGNFQEEELVISGRKVTVYKRGKAGAQQSGQTYSTDVRNIYQPEKLFVSDKQISVKSDWLPEKLISNIDGENTLNPVERGIITHKLLENIINKSNISEVVVNAALEGLISAEEIPVWEKQLRDIVHHPAIVPFFSEDVTAINERGIISPGMKVQRPDRIVIRDEELYIIDYKTGRRQEIYRDQIQSYANLFFAMGYKNIKGYILYTDLVELDEIALNFQMQIE